MAQRSPIAAVAAALLVAGCSVHSGQDTAGPQPRATSATTETADAAVPDIGDARATGGFEPADEAADGDPGHDKPPLTERTEVATVTGPEIWSTSTPSDRQDAQWFPNPTQFGGPRVFRVVDSTSHPEQIRVSLPSMPNGQFGWIARDEVTITKIDHQVEVDLARREATVWAGDRQLVKTPVVVGTPWTPTPTGVFYLRDIIRQPDPSGAYGPYILALSGFSETLETFNGGLPAIALHGTDNPGAMGRPQSNGCVRLPNEIVESLAHDLPLGTPVVILTGRAEGSLNRAWSR